MIAIVQLWQFEVLLLRCTGPVHCVVVFFDVTKHAVRTIIRTLGPQDRLCIVAYSPNARTGCGLMKMASRAPRRHSRACVRAGSKRGWKARTPTVVGVPYLATRAV